MRCLLTMWMMLMFMLNCHWLPYKPEQNLIDDYSVRSDSLLEQRRKACDYSENNLTRNFSDNVLRIDIDRF